MVLKASTRDANASTNSGQFIVTFNGDTSTTYSQSWLSGANNATIGSAGYGSNTQINVSNSSMMSGGSTANAFAVVEMYIPNYTSTAVRVIYDISASPNMSNNDYEASEGGQYRGGSTISSLNVSTNQGGFVAGSRFDLYGIVHF